MKETKKCHRCEAEIWRGSFCPRCSYELAMGIKTVFREEVTEICEDESRLPMTGRMHFIGTERRYGRCLCR